MIYKVLFQELISEAPVRENTKSIYIEANSEMDVREKLASKSYNIEVVLPVDGVYLEYEKQNENFKLENI
ncbi:hypothetical protein BKP35_11110 [Anaerobacillus arseniciselenatis]|uniref:DNA-directed RNA polymerase subunit epsilon n=1 Tax=Anaerobacillus arseniciselenatis TaxID=85682 RepID=A0A1S2LKY4_9BACI|nr:DNA-directed RNA polymerase subunit epsilon [Anaerobacillus arseniciselenatis]OIJ12115.1 hypothetical protein BKP35_11110 [Anaerobacillus arseniciselenatis]